MRDNFYRLGYSLAAALPVGIALFCIYIIRRNRREIKKLEEREKRSGSPAPKTDDAKERDRTE